MIRALVDVPARISVADAASMIEFFTGMSDVPFVVAANKVDPNDSLMLSADANDARSCG